MWQAYFRDFKFDGLDRPWRAFTGSWSRAAIARHLGINSSFITGDHCYVLVRVARFRESKRLAAGAGFDSLALDEAVAREADNVTIGDTASVIRFIKNFGSHYIASYVTGNSLYQVRNYSQLTGEDAPAIASLRAYYGPRRLGRPYRASFPALVIRLLSRAAPGWIPPRGRLLCALIRYRV